MSRPNRRDFLVNELASYHQKQYKKILSDPENYFDSAKIINFDLIHNQCRGGELKHGRSYCETLYLQKLLKIEDSLYRYNFISEAKRSERSDVHFEEGLLESHLKSDIRTQLKKGCLF